MYLKMAAFNSDLRFQILRSSSSVCRLAKKLSAIALSWALSTRPMLPSTPLRSKCRPKAKAVFDWIQPVVATADQSPWPCCTLVMYRRCAVRTVNVSETREKLAELLLAVEAGEEIIITRRDRAVARLVALDRTMSPFPDRSQLRREIPPLNTSAAEIVRELRDEERY